MGAGASALTLWKNSAISGSSPDAKVTCDVRVDSVSTTFTQFGVAARLKSTNDAGYWCYYNRVNGFWRLARINATGLGSVNLADSSAQTYTAGTNITVELSVSGAGAAVAIELKVNGSSVLTYSDTSANRLVDAGNTGLSFQSGGNGLGWFVNSMTVDDVVSAGDTTAPVLTLPTGTATGTTTATGSVTTDTGEGALYHITTTSSTATVSAVKAGSSQAVTSAGSKSISVTGLSASTTYYHHFVHTDASANDSAVASSAGFTTSSASTPEIDLSDPVVHVLKNNTGAVYTSVAYRCTIVNYSTGAFVAIKTGTTTAGGLVGVLTDAALVAGTDYWVIVEPGASGAYGIYRATAS